MINTELLELKIKMYMLECHNMSSRPTYKGIGKILGISESTISNVVHGFFNGHPYTSKPHVNRCINNQDFKIIRNIFS